MATRDIIEMVTCIGVSGLMAGMCGGAAFYAIGENTLSDTSFVLATILGGALGLWLWTKVNHRLMSSAIAEHNGHSV